MNDDNTSFGRGVLVISLTALFTALAYNGFSGTGLPLIRTAPPKVAVSDAEIFGHGGGQGGAAPAEAASAVEDSAAGGPFRIITLSQMKRIVVEKKGIVADARTPDEYAAGHLAGSINLYAMEPENYVEKIADLPRDTLVAVYCSNPHCPFARTVAELLGTFGFTNILLYDDGYDGWTGARLPVVEGDR
jgi:rhodanese-related sulfurtransferase